jgi:hypothetical protein
LTRAKGLQVERYSPPRTGVARLVPTTILADNQALPQTFHFIGFTFIGLVFKRLQPLVLTLFKKIIIQVVEKILYKFNIILC